MVRGLLGGMLVLALLMAGCSSPGSRQTTGTETPSLSPADSSSAEPAPEMATGPTTPLVGACSITRTAVNTPLGYGVNPDKALSDTSCPFSAVANGSLARFAYAVVELSWQVQPGETSISLDVGADCKPDDARGPFNTGSCGIGHTAGTSAPLRVVLTPETMKRYGDGHPFATVYADGASVQHPFDLRISLFEQGPVGDDYTGFTLL